MSDMTVAKTILDQLGGRKFVTMTGAKNFLAGGNALTFRIPGGGGFAKDGINAVKVTLNGLDLYDVVYTRVRGTKLTVVSESKDIYADMLTGDFENATGLATSLGIVRR